MEIKLKPCPFCGGKAKLKHGFPSRQRGDMRQATVQCLECGCRTVTYHQMAYEPWEMVDRQAVETWNNRVKTEADELSNDPLTLDELREMDGEPVWIVGADDAAIDCNGYAVVDFHYYGPDMPLIFWFGNEVEDEPKIENYGITWLAYRRRPKEDANEAN